MSWCLPSLAEYKFYDITGVRVSLYSNTSLKIFFHDSTGKIGERGSLTVDEE